jgi:hypothetical protein
VGTDQVSLADPEALLLDEATSRACWTPCARCSRAKASRCTGARRCAGTGARMLADLATASLDRVIGRNVDRWLPAGRDARADAPPAERGADAAVHPPAERRARGRRGCPPSTRSGSAAAAACPDGAVAAAGVQVDDALRQPALAEDWAGLVRRLGRWMPARSRLPAPTAALRSSRCAANASRSWRPAAARPAGSAWPAAGAAGGPRAVLEAL